MEKKAYTNTKPMPPMKKIQWFKALMKEFMKRKEKKG